MLWLGVETSCDETAVAIVDCNESGFTIRGSKVSSQIRSHQPFGGVVPELAVREHLRNLPEMVPSLLKECSIERNQVEGIAVTEGPGLAACLLIGHSYARGLGLSLGIPVIGVNHLEGHLLSPFISGSEVDPFPFVTLVVSGGHTLLMVARSLGKYQKLGGTVDDAAGEAFDKVARLLGLSYPGGPEIERMAIQGNPTAYPFPKSFPERDNFNFSFSGLKTSVRYFLDKHPRSLSDPQFIADVCASFQEAVVQVLVRKTILAAETSGCRLITAAGGVVCNQRLREVLTESGNRAGIVVKLAAGSLCTDNAAMIAAAAAWRVRQGATTGIGPDINPNLPL